MQAPAQDRVRLRTSAHPELPQLAWNDEGEETIQPELLLAAVRSAHDMIAVVNQAGIIEYVNPAFCSGTGYSAAEAIGQRISMLKSGKHTPAFYRELWQTILSGRVWHGEISNRRKDGTEYLEEQSITPVRDCDGTFARFIAIKRDISNRKRAEESLRHSEEKHRTLFESSRDAIFIANADTGIIVDANPAATTLMGIPKFQLIGMHQSELHSKDKREHHKRVFAQAVDAGHSLVSDVELERPDGELVPVELSGSTFTLGSTGFIQCHFRDIRERVRAEKEVHSAHVETIVRLARAAEQRDDETGRHIQRMSSYCAWLAERIGLPADRCEVIRLASAMHDVGKIGIPDRILLKPGRLSPYEYSIMKQHVDIGHRILLGSRVPLLQVADAIAWTHHERYDGTGYPRGLAGENIPLEGRIAAIADAFDALTTKRVYKEAYPMQRTVAIMREGRGTRFDPELLDRFLANLAELQQIKERCDRTPLGNMSLTEACVASHQQASA